MPIGVYKKTEEHKRKISESLKGHKCSEETRKKIGAVHKGLPMEKQGNWKGGFTKKGNGYLQFRALEGCKFSCMKDCKGYIQLHRLIMAEYLQRPLENEEVVHHINGDITDNRIENLKLFENKSKHTSLHHKLRNNQKGGVFIKHYNGRFYW